MNLGGRLVKLIIGSDHAGYELKEKIRQEFAKNGETIEDFGTTNEESCDYPEVGLKVAEAVVGNEDTLGLLVCGTGVGMSIAANKVPGVRAALAHNTYVAQYAREHNNANILVLPGRIIGKDMAVAMIQSWLNARFLGDRHQRRIDKITEIEKKYSR